MLFNSPVFIFLFLPVAIAVYFFLNGKKLFIAGKAWLVLASLFFYGYWNPSYLFLILGSILVNFSIGSGLHKTSKRAKGRLSRKSVLTFGVLFNIALLGYFKYSDFFIDNVNVVFSTQFPLMNVVLPLAISFFTFQQIAYLVDTYRNECAEFDFLSYCLFVTFFPQLIAGPIVHHKEMMPQFNNPKLKFLNLRNIALGLLIFTMGLFKKVVLADSLAQYADPVFDAALTESIAFVPAWLGALAYTFQIYFDFSGYCDMAIGAALFFNIKIPINFLSPYKAVNIQDFWRRWHITLSRWLRDYVYINLGGNRISQIITLRNVFATAFVSGIWHGAGWTFVLWGVCHGSALVIHRLYSDYIQWTMPRPMAWFLTFLFVVFAWVLFRAETLPAAQSILIGMVNIGTFQWPQFVEFNQGIESLTQAPRYFESVLGLYWILLAAIIAVFGVWSIDLAEQVLKFRHNHLWIGATFSVLLFVTMISLGNDYSAFIYFNF